MLVSFDKRLLKDSMKSMNEIPEQVVIIADELATLTAEDVIAHGCGTEGGNPLIGLDIGTAAHTLETTPVVAPAQHSHDLPTEVTVTGSTLLPVQYLVVFRAEQSVIFGEVATLHIQTAFHQRSCTH